MNIKPNSLGARMSSTEFYYHLKSAGFSLVPPSQPTPQLKTKPPKKSEPKFEELPEKIEFERMTHQEKIEQARREIIERFYARLAKKSKKYRELMGQLNQLPASVEIQKPEPPKPIRLDKLNYGPKTRLRHDQD